MGFALSTSWNAFRHTHGKTILQEIKKLGFSKLELSFNLTEEIVAQIEQEIRKNRKFSITSVHNFCPIPDGFPREKALPDCYSLASCNEVERLQAVSYTKKSIDTALRVGAQAVVVHCGRVDIPDHTRTLIDLYELGRKHSKEFLSLRDAMIREREVSVRSFLTRALRSLEELSGYAASHKIVLGIETRFYHREIPSLEEMRVIFHTFKNSWLRYWHDTGHAQVMEYLGFCRHTDYLEELGNEMGGIHLHDVTGCIDHQAPGVGELDFSLLKRYLKEETIKVIEPHHPATAQEIQEAKALLTQQFLLS